MKKNALLYIALVLILSFISLSAGAFLNYFHARSESENVMLSWQTGEERDLNHFSIMRKPANGAFTEIANIDAKGSNSYYEYTDQNAYKADDAVYVYKLKIVDNNGLDSYSNEVTVAHTVSSVKRTWGSIKALFR